MRSASTELTDPLQFTSPISLLSGGGNSLGRPISRQGSFCETDRPATWRRVFNASTEFTLELQSTFPVPGPSQASPARSPSESIWSAFATVGQLSEPVQPAGPPLGDPGEHRPSRSGSTCE